MQSSSSSKPGYILRSSTEVVLALGRVTRRSCLPGLAMLVCPLCGRVGGRLFGTMRTVQLVRYQEGGVTMRDDERQTYERPTLTPAGSFKNVTGLGGHGPKDTVMKKQLL